MTEKTTFDLEHFLPYLLNQAAEATSRSFQAIYAEKYGLTRTQWRVLAHLGKFGAMSAKEICTRSHIEKTKVSRAIAALEGDGLLGRCEDAADRRAEILSLTRSGKRIFAELGKHAQDYDHGLRAKLGVSTSAELIRILRMLTDMNNPL